MNSIEKIAITNYNYGNSNLYAKLLKFAKFKSDDQYFGESSRFIINLEDSTKYKSSLLNLANFKSFA